MQVKWDSGSTVAAYARRMAVSGWGGGIEMAAFARCRKMNVYVYEQTKTSGYKRISAFDTPGSRGTAYLIYQGGVHYDALQPH